MLNLFGGAQGPYALPKGTLESHDEAHVNVDDSNSAPEYLHGRPGQQDIILSEIIFWRARGRGIQSGIRIQTESGMVSSPTV